MKSIKILLLLFVSIFLYTSCTPKLTPFTQELQYEFEWNEDDLQKIQFYLSEDVILQRNLSAEESKITDGKIRIVDGRRVEEVIFQKGVPGVVLFTPKSDRFAVGFEASNDRYLMFGPNKKYGGRYVLLAKDWDRRVGQVTYSNKLWRVSSEDAYASLLVDLKAARRISKKSRTAEGRKID